jgi:hypothetical protein
MTRPLLWLPIRYASTLLFRMCCGAAKSFFTGYWVPHLRRSFIAAKVGPP